MKCDKSLTLIELLIASAILLVVMLTIYSGFHTGIFGYRNIQENIEMYQTARQILERINLDLRNAFSYSQAESRFAGSPNKLSFLTLVDSYQGDNIVQDYAFISYQLDNNKLMRLCRKNQDSLNKDSLTSPEEMVSYIGALVFSYGYIDVDTQERKFYDSWGYIDEQKKALPLSVKVKLTLLTDRVQEEFEREIFLPWWHQD